MSPRGKPITSQSQSRPTIHDVARRAKVSKSLVSMVTRGEDGVSDEKRKGIPEAIEELNYRPNLMVKLTDIDMSIEEIVGEYTIMGTNQDAGNETYKGTLSLSLDSNKRITAEWIIHKEQKQTGSGFLRTIYWL